MIWQKKPLCFSSLVFYKICHISKGVYAMIELLNVKPGDTFQHSIIYLFGIVSCPIGVSPPQCVQVEGQHSDTHTIQWPVIKSYFKVIETILISVTSA